MKKYFILLAALSFFCNAGYTQADKSDSLALVDLYNSSYGQYVWVHRDNWLTAAPLNTWYGITLNDTGRVSQISLPSNFVFGQLPASFARLSALTICNLNSNYLQGNVMETVSGLNNLTYLDIGSNQIQDTIPGSLGNLTKLTYLDISRNQLSGIIPSGMKTLSLLDTLKLNNNQISDIDPYIAFLSSLVYVDLSHNLLSSLPSLAGNFPLLTHFDISDNAFGNVPSFQRFIYALRDLHQLTYLNFRNDHLSGTIPAGLDTLHTLDTLILDSNRFTFDGMEQAVNASYPYLSYTQQQGTLPLIKGNDTISVNAGGTPANDTFRLYRNNVLFQTQTGDSAFKLTQNGIYYISVTNKIANQLTLTSARDTFVTGSLAQDSLALVTLYDSTGGPDWTNSWDLSKPISTWHGVTITNNRVSELDLGSNNLSGTLPAAIDNLTYLTSLNLNFNITGSGFNKITGRFPYIGDLTNLSDLSLGGNSVTIDTIPADWILLTSLAYLDLSGDHINGSIPAGFGSLANLKELLLSNNNLTGKIPAELGNLSKLNYLDLSSNKLAGSIPQEIGNLANLQQLFLDNNNLSGNIPSTLGNLSNLTWLDAGTNQLTGSIPSSTGNLTKLIQLSFQVNRLSGAVPASLTNLTGLATLYLSRNNFTFDGMEAIDSAFDFAYYYPQAAVTLNRKDKALSVYAGGTLANDTFRLFKDGQLLTSQIADSVFKITDDGAYYITVTNAKAGKLTLNSDTIIVTGLPVTLIDFTGIVEKNNVLLQWQTATETNNKRFETERSADGIVFSKIGSVAGHGNSSVIKYYSFADTNPLNGTNYYRLKQIDNDGAYAYSKIVSVSFESNDSLISVYPNPAKDYINIKIANAGVLSVYNASGALVKTTLLQSGINIVDIHHLSAGIYFGNINGQKIKFMKCP